jgi:hypothetical protein
MEPVVAYASCATQLILLNCIEPQNKLKKNEIQLLSVNIRKKVLCLNIFLLKKSEFQKFPSTVH